MTQLPVTVIVPCLNEAGHIQTCIDALARQNLPETDYEIVVVDNGSTDGTVEAVAQTRARLLTQPVRSPYRARNLAIDQSDSEYVALTDARCLADPNWLPTLLAKARETQALLVGGLTCFRFARSNLGSRLFRETHLPSQMRTSIEQYHCVGGGNMLIHRSAFERYGKFKSIRSGSDIEFSKRLAQQGYPPVFAEHAVVTRQHDLSNWSYLKRCYRIRFGQRMHSTKPSGYSAAISQLVNVPWRPGLRAARGPEWEGTEEPNFVSHWLYRWATRWAGFLGELHGTVAARESASPS